MYVLSDENEAENLPDTASIFDCTRLKCVASPAIRTLFRYLSWTSVIFSLGRSFV